MTVTPPPRDPAAAALAAQLRALTEEKILAALRLRGPRSFSQLRRDLPNLAFREIDNALIRLRKSGCIRPSDEGSPRWHLTPAGLEQLPSLARGESTASATPQPSTAA